MCSTSILGLKPSKPIIYTNIPSQIQGGDEEAILSLKTRSRKRPGGWDLVNYQQASPQRRQIVSEEHSAEDDDE